LRLAARNLTVNPVKWPRSAGILLHPTSLPGRFGIGDLGPEAYEFVNFLTAAGMHVWQVLPLNPTGYGDSPYQCFSAFAGNPLLISPKRLYDRRILDAAALRSAPVFPQDQVDYGRVIDFKVRLLTQAAHTFFSSASGADRTAFETFCCDNSSWLDDYAVFMSVKSAYHGALWTKWEPGLVHREPNALNRWITSHAGEIKTHKYWQFEFLRQWQELKTHCRQFGVQIMGDVPIYVAHDSADVWAHQDIFRLKEDGCPSVIAGVPPDYFSATGQCWGNPIYSWDVLKTTGYDWWIARVRGSLRLFDRIRLDHFRGFEAYWEIPGDETTAVRGRWVGGPGAEFFSALQSVLGELPVVAENLGVITPAVEAIRKQFGFPGMSLLQFAFGNDPQGPSFRPHNYERDVVAYTGGHDNDTTVGWWTSEGTQDSTRTWEDVRKERAFAQAYLGFHDEPINWVFIRAVMASVADTAIIPLQDVLGLGSEARMNLPGTPDGNWRWRCRPDALTDEHVQRLKTLVRMYDR